MITKEKLAAVNKTLETMDIKGSEYATVAARINAFREICPSGGIDTVVCDIDDEHVLIQAKVFDENGHQLSSGTAKEDRKPAEELSDNEKKRLKINLNSYVENCETSAVGRALANLGIGSKENIASAEELAQALLRQQTLLTGKRLLTLYCDEHALDAAKVSEEHGLDTAPKGSMAPFYKVVAELMEKNGE